MNKLFYLSAAAVVSVALAYQGTDQDAVTAHTAIDSMAARIVALNADLKAEREKTAQLTQSNSDLKAQLETAQSSDKVLTWIKAFPALYGFLGAMTSVPVSSFYTPGFAQTPQGERYTLACISNSGMSPTVLAAPVVTK